MSNLIPYLMFNGECREAFNFYKDCFDGEIEFMGTYDGSPMEVPEDQKDKVMHATVRILGEPIMGSDYVKEADYTTQASGSNVHMCLSFEDTGSMEKAFGKMSEGGKVTLPLQDQFWGDRFGMFTDKFGIQWMFSCYTKKAE